MVYYFWTHLGRVNPQFFFYKKSALLVHITDVSFEAQKYAEPTEGGASKYAESTFLLNPKPLEVPN